MSGGIALWTTGSGTSERMSRVAGCCRLPGGSSSLACAGPAAFASSRSGGEMSKCDAAIE
jgi:hypothetical protein